MKNLFRSGNIEFKTSQMAFAESNKKTHMTHNLINVSKLAIPKYTCKTSSKKHEQYGYIEFENNIIMFVILNRISNTSLAMKTWQCFFIDMLYGYKYYRLP